MKIDVIFDGGSEYWRKKVRNSTDHASQILSDPRFIEKIATWPRFDYCPQLPKDIAKTIRAISGVVITVGFYSSWWTRAIAYEENDSVYFNTRKEAYGAGGVGNVVHEVMHALGYSHNGNAAAGNENSVPYRVGEWADGWTIREWLEADKSQDPSSWKALLPFCPPVMPTESLASPLMPNESPISPGPESSA